jgi:hypothetical protein
VLPLPPSMRRRIRPRWAPVRTGISASRIAVVTYSFTALRSADEARGWRSIAAAASRYACAEVAASPCIRARAARLGQHAVGTARIGGKQELARAIEALDPHRVFVPAERCGFPFV